MDDTQKCLSTLKLEYSSCPGRFCGRVLLNETLCAFSECQKCPRGFRPSDLDVCSPCTNEPSLYDYMYLGFMFNLSIVFHFVFIDRSMRVIDKKVYKLNWIKTCSIYALSVLECVLAFVLSSIIFSPNRSLKLQTCSVQSLYDWYTIFFNPYINYYHKLNCSQEIVYPLYSFLLVYFMFSVVIMIVCRPFLLRFLFKSELLPVVLNKPIFAALYFFPFLTLMHVIAGGLLYYSYPIITIITFLISNAHYLCKQFKSKSAFENSLASNFKFLFKLLLNLRHLGMIVVHCYFYAFAILAIIEFKYYILAYYNLLFVPLPLVFFVVSYKYSDPKNFRV